jgi:hypothetical protein
VTDGIAPPIIVARGDDCAFYRTEGDAVQSGISADARVFDGHGRRLVVGGDGLDVATVADGADELAELLSTWLRAMDALRESTANWSLELLVRASVDHLGFS